LVTDLIFGGPVLGCFGRGGAGLVKGGAGSLDGRGVGDRNSGGGAEVDRRALGRLAGIYRSGNTRARGLSVQSRVTMAPWLSSASQS
jgi:hypothetical protein